MDTFLESLNRQVVKTVERNLGRTLSEAVHECSLKIRDALEANGIRATAAAPEVEYGDHRGGVDPYKLGAAVKALVSTGLPTPSAHEEFYQLLINEALKAKGKKAGDLLN